MQSQKLKTIFFGVEEITVPESMKSNSNVKYVGCDSTNMLEIFEKEVQNDGKIHIHLDLESISEAEGVT